MITQEQIVQSLIYITLMECDKSIAIVCPRMDMCKTILQRFYTLHSELPDYLQVKIVDHLKTYAETENGNRIHLMSNPHHGCGIALSVAYVHDSLKTDEDMMACLYPSLVWSKIDSDSSSNLIWFN